MFKLYTDGSTLGNGKECSYGAYAWALYKNENLIETHSKEEISTTNNRMEMKAIISGVEYFLQNYPNEILYIYSDSAYIINCYKDKWYIKWQNNNWVNSKKQPVLNKDLWEKIIPYFTDQHLSFSKVKGHDKCVGNILVDQLANTKAQEARSEHEHSNYN